MAKTDRVLELLEALQDRPSASGPELAARLGVDTRTVRRDVESLRALGIPVEAERGPAGGYRLRPGYRMPPLLFTTGEATAVALGLLTARRDGLDADGALAKLHRVLPDRAAVRGARADASGDRATARRGAAAERAPAPARRGRRRARRGRRRATPRATAPSPSARLSPYGLVAHAARWYVPAHDHGRGEPRALRADRFGAVRLAGRRRAAAAGLRRRRLRGRDARPGAVDARGRGRARAAAGGRDGTLPAALAELSADGERTVLRMRAESLDWLAGLLANAGCDFMVRRPDGLRREPARTRHAACGGLRGSRRRAIDLDPVRADLRARVGRRWQRAPAPPLQPRESAIGLWTGSEALIIGGSAAAPCPSNASCDAPDEPPLRDGAAFDPRTRTWRRLARAPVGFEFAQRAVVGRTAYLSVPGSPVRPRAPRAFLGYQFDRDRWRRMPEHPAARLHAAGGR